MIYLHYKDTKTFGHSFSFLLIFKTLRASYLQVGNFSKLIAKGEYDAAVGYEHLIADFPDVESVKNDEKRHGDIVSGLLDL